jgi:hypothetical protein
MTGKDELLTCGKLREVVTTPELAGCLRGHEVWVPHISLVFREMWVYREALVQAPW